MRKVVNLNKDWKFIQKNVGLPQKFPEKWNDVQLPHTWNAIDGHDGLGSYDKGSYWYAKTFDIIKQPIGKTITYIEVLAAGQQATVYVNGYEVASHEGGYSAFRANVTEYVNEKDNLLVINCSNEYKDNIYPQKADFTFYGGLYRGVNLISVPEQHFDLDYFGSLGIKATPINNTVELEAFTKNTDDNFSVEFSIDDNIAYGTKTSIEIPEVHKWSIEDPYQYTVNAKLIRRNEVYDEVETKIGFRDFSCDPNKGFFLNGEYKKLRGVARHQDRLYKGNALTREDHYEDAKIIKELGANTIRLAHYQHSQDFYDACDELGFIVWAEIPFISVFNENPAAHENCKSQLKELIIQNYHHPSICFWGLSNEIELGGDANDQLVANHKELNAIAHKLDKTRLTTIAHLSWTPADSPLHDVPDVISYNHYFGWYGGKIEDTAKVLDQFHKDNPNVASGMSEYGCEGIITYHSSNPQCKDYTEEYQALYHEYNAKVINERPYLWSTHVWNMFDFGCAERDEGGVSGRNNKGLVTMDRKIKKDSYYIYKAYWNSDPFVHICGKRYAKRASDGIKIYSNEKDVKLYINDELVAELKANKVFNFDVKLKDGINHIVAKSKNSTDTATIEKVKKEPEIFTLPEFNERQEGVANWFEKVTEDLNAPMVFPTGKYSIKDKIEDLVKSPEAKKIAMTVVKLTQNMNIDPDDPSSMYRNFRDRTIEVVLDQGEDLCPEGFRQSVNAKLIKILKED